MHGRVFRLSSLKKHTLIVADVAQTHEGSLGLAHAFIDSVSKTGVDAIKFQTHIAEEESTRREKWRKKFSYQDVSRYDYWKRMEFSEDQWHGLKHHADEAGLLFISSPFSIKAVEILSRVGVFAWKIASGEVKNHFMFQAMEKTGLPLLMSTGMSPLLEIDAAVHKVKSMKKEFAVLQCTTEYPCPPEKIGLNLIPFFKERYCCPVGISDHSGSVFPGLAAAVMGAEIIEVHVTLSREMFGPDVSSSLTTSELKQLADGVRYIEIMRSNPVDKNEIAREKAEWKKLFGKSIVAKRDLPAGRTLRRSDLAFKKPGHGVAPEQMAEVLGKRLKHPLKKDSPLRRNDYE